MKWTLFAIVVILSASIGFAQAPQPAKTDSLFLVSIGVGSAWDKTKKPEEQADFNAHVEWLKKSGADGTMKFGARNSGKGLLIVKASSMAKAKSLLDEDVAIRNKMLVAEVTRLNVFHGGCLLE